MMEIKKFEQVVFGDEYYSLEDLRYNQKIGLLLSKDELKDFMYQKERLIIDGNKNVKVLPLKTFNSKYCYYTAGAYLLNKYSEYLEAFASDFAENSRSLSDRNFEDIIISRLFSEVEGTLNIENVPTTHKRIKEVFKAEKLTDKNDIIIKNMQNALNFIMEEKPAFNKENLFKLYNLLSKACLDEDNQLKDGAYYRDDIVSVGGFDGAPSEKIDELMNSLFDFVNNPANIKEYDILLPHICHYYILYVHPYFDYNGRTARMVSFWLNYLNKSFAAPFYMSEAINETKKDYYKALTNTRTTGNDLTYFLGYILDTAIKFNFIYKNIECIKDALSKKGDFLTSTELTYLKKIIIHNPEDYFNYKMFFEYINVTMSKQAAFKILNHLADYEILVKSTNKKNEAIYKVNQEFITYKFNK